MRGMTVGIDAHLNLAGWLASGVPTSGGYVEDEPPYQSWPQMVGRLKAGNHP